MHTLAYTDFGRLCQRWNGGLAKCFLILNVPIKHWNLTFWEEVSFSFFFSISSNVCCCGTLFIFKLVCEKKNSFHDAFAGVASLLYWSFWWCCHPWQTVAPHKLHSAVLLFPSFTLKFFQIADMMTALLSDSSQSHSVDAKHAAHMCCLSWLLSALGHVVQCLDKCLCVDEATGLDQIILFFSHQYPIPCFWPSSDRFRSRVPAHP